MIVWHGYEIDFPKLKDTDMADLQKYTSDLGNALSRELLKFNSQLAEAQKDFENLGKEVEENIKELEDTKTFIANSMKTLQTEGTSIHVADSADYPCKLEIEGKSEQTQTEQSANLCPNVDSDKWVLSGGAYKENGYIVLPQVGAKAEMVVEWNGQTVEDDGLFKCYWGANMVTEDTENAKYLVEAIYLNENKQTITSNGNSAFIGDTDIWKGFYFVYSEDTSYGQAIRDAKYIRYRITYGSTNTASYKFKNPLISKTSSSTYVEFIPDSPSPDYPSQIENVSGDLEIKTVAKNLMKCETDVQTKYGVTITKTDDGGYILNGTSTGVGSNGISLVSFEHNFPLLKNNSYAYSIGFENVPNKRVSFPIAVKQVDGTIKHNYKSINTESATAPVVFIPSEDLTTDNVAVYIHNGTVFNNFKFKIQIEEGTVATDYEPYKEQTVTFPFTEGQKLMQGGYLGDDGIHNKRRQLILTGQESWYKRNNTNNTFYLTLNNISIKGICNTYKTFSASNEIDTKDGIYLSNSSYAIVTDLRFTDVTEFKNWLAEQYTNGTPVIIEYEVEKEEVTPYTEEQQTAYNNLQKLKTYRSVTNISNSQNTNMQLTYKMDLQTQIAGGGSSA